MTALTPFPSNADPQHGSLQAIPVQSPALQAAVQGVRAFGLTEIDAAPPSSVTLTPSLLPKPDENGQPSLDHVDTSEEVIQKHTAAQPSRQLNFDYTVQCLRTGLPLLIVDLVVAVVSIVTSAALINVWQGHAFHQGVPQQLPAWLIIQTGLIWLHQLYPGASVAAVSELRGIARSALYTCLCLCSLNLIFGHLPRIEFSILVATAGFVAAGLPLARHIARSLLARTSWWGVRTLMIGSHSVCAQLCKRFQSRRETGMIVIGYVCNQQDFLHYGAHDENLLAAGYDSFEIACAQHAPVAALASPEAEPLAPRLMFQFPSLVWLDSSATMHETVNPVGTFHRRLNVPFLRFTPRFLKRTLDLALVIPGLLVLAMPMAIIAIAIKIKSPGPIIYGSPRVGQQGRSFKMWKFRSMVPNADDVLQQRLDSDPEAKSEWDATNKLKNDPRIISGIGRWMRSCSLDELPQLWNVLVGQMSLVGPRPVPAGEIVKYQDQYFQYSQMWPGITGLWQVSGRNDTSFETRVFLVHHYAANWSLWLDAWILVKTPMTVLTRKGAY